MHPTEFRIPFNKPALVGPELEYIRQAIAAGQLAGNGLFTKRCQEFFESEYTIHRALLTHSGTAALEMAALLLNLQPGDEVIVPSFTFTSTANAFVLRGVRVVFADSSPTHPNVDVSRLASLITPRTRAVVPVHYAGVACDMAALAALAQAHSLAIVEDAAQAVESYYHQQRLGTFGCLSAFSFHETKNLIAGEGGLLAINDPALARRAEIIWEKGTNRAAFYRGETARYQWVDVGSSFLPSEMTAAYLWAQLEQRQVLQQRRLAQWRQYAEALAPLQALGVELPIIPDYAQQHNGHIFYLICRTAAEQQALLAYLHQLGILAVFHYQTLHDSPYYQAQHDGRPLPHAHRYATQLVRLPLYFDLSAAEQAYVIDAVLAFYQR
ncbi:dTDP-4-amino-4,6-dideoxygalactose transaminase [Hymenobacter lutimineralis]|uniref:dTDP-4-amino-4,6-dideoxygalactose transaminase n=1 Tax=Hymenobacter lutimineralis TaxID=2606448 RepID=A0A5D6VBH1_9BACT|nr:dTDP-4-amino-4,6-dideoxygalactose transaminase [Hymenobacter lutimineralis]TYZ11914.1 dTDP-4-amino-4,6-dideoxygalactose transaminase [Hymenobacter lutimineralis]